MSSAKNIMIETINKQPDDSSYSEILRELAFHEMVEAGIKDSDNNNLVDEVEVDKQIKSWVR